MANGRCRNHGGCSPSGIASPHHRGAGRSRYIPTGWQRAYGEALDDPELLSLRADLARTDAQIDALLQQLPETGAEEEAWGAFVAHFHAAMASLATARAPETPEEQQDEAMRDFWIALEMAQLLAREGAQHHSAALEVEGRLSALTETRRRLVDSETKRISTAVQSVPVQTVRGIVWALLEILRHEIADRTLLGRIQERFRREFAVLAQRGL